MLYYAAANNPKCFCKIFAQIIKEKLSESSTKPTDAVTDM